VLAALAVLHKQHRATEITALLEAIAVLALGALPVVGQQGLVVKQHHKVLGQQGLPLQMPLLFFLLKQVRQVFM
jgi:hypothetical protein